MNGFHDGDINEGPLPPEAHAAIADALASAARSLIGQPFQVGHRVVYVGADPELNGKHGTLAVESTFPYLEGSTIVGVRFDGHDAIWSIHPSHLAHLALELHDPGCDCPPHVAATVTAVAAVRATSGADATPSLVQLDRDDAAQQLADAAADVLDVVSSAGGIGHVHPHVRVLVKALADFREVAR